MSVGVTDPSQQLTVPGAIIAGKYRVERVLGRGGMGVVIAATHLQLEQLVAIKFLLPEACAVPNAVARFMQEAKAAVRIRSEHIGRVMDVAMLDDGTPYIVMEFLEGSDLAHILAARGPMPIPETILYLLQACEAISEAHSLGIVHRDLKPANLFIATRADGSPLLKVLDFGISKSLSASTTGASLTGTAFIMGSPQYMSPEQVRSSKHVDTRTDIWSLGVIAHELLTGNPPFSADTAPALLIQIAVESPAPIRTQRPDIPVELERIFLQCLAKDPNERIQSIPELAQLLAPFGPPNAPAPRIVTRAHERAVVTSPVAVAGSTIGNFSQTRQRGGLSSWTRPASLGVAVILVAGLGAAIAWRLKPSASVPAVSTLQPVPVGSTSIGAAVEAHPPPNVNVPVVSVTSTAPQPSAIASAGPPTPSKPVPPKQGDTSARPPSRTRAPSATKVGGSIDPLEDRR